MNLNYSILAEDLQDLKITIVPAQTDTPLKELRYLSAGQAYHNDYLYFASSDTFRQFTEKALPNNIAIASCDASGIEVQPGHTYMCIHEGSPDFLIFSRLQDLFTDYQDWHARMLNAIIMNNGIKNILDIAAQKLLNPIALFDTTASLIHWSGKFMHDTSGSIWEKVLQKGHTLDFYTFAEWADISSRLNSSSAPFIYKSSSDPENSLLICPIKCKGRFIASLGMCSINEPITDRQRHLIEIIRDILELALKNSVQLRRESATYYMECLLSGIAIEDKTVNYYLKRRGWSLESTYCLFNFACPNESDNYDSITNPYMGWIEGKFPSGLLCSHEESIVMIINTEECDPSSPGTRQALEELYDKFQLQCGISAEFYNFTTLKYYYIQSKAALTEGRHENPGQPYYLFLNFYKQNLARALDAVTSLKSLVHPRILQLWNSGDDKLLSLIQTLWAYLLNGRNITTTSDLLHIHRNTLLYRLEKISDYLKMDLGHLDADTLFYLFISCFIIENL